MGVPVRPRLHARQQGLTDAVALLTEHGRARLEVEGRRRFVVVNPALYRS